MVRWWQQEGTAKYLRIVKREWGLSREDVGMHAFMEICRVSINVVVEIGWMLT